MRKVIEYQVVNSKLRPLKNKLFFSITYVCIALMALSCASVSRSFNSASFNSAAKVDWSKQLKKSFQFLFTGVLTFWDLKENQSQSAHFELWSVKGQKMRLDLTHPLGGAVGAILIGPKRTRALFYHDKMAILANSKKIIISSGIRIALSHGELASILALQSPKGWVCEVPGYVCEKESADLSYIWQKDLEFLEIQGESFKLKLEMESFQAKEISPTVWKLKTPPKFKKYRIR